MYFLSRAFFRLAREGSKESILGAQIRCVDLSKLTGWDGSVWGSVGVLMPQQNCKARLFQI